MRETDFAKTQALLSVSLTFYEFALVADRNDDATYSPTELQDLLRSLTLSYHDEEPTPKQVTALTERFDSLVPQPQHGRLDARHERSL